MFILPPDTRISVPTCLEIEGAAPVKAAAIVALNSIKTDPQVAKTKLKLRYSDTEKKWAVSIPK